MPVIPVIIIAVVMVIVTVIVVTVIPVIVITVISASCRIIYITSSILIIMPFPVIIPVVVPVIMTPVVVIAPVVIISVPVELIFQIIFHFIQIIFYAVDGIIHPLCGPSPAVIPAIVESVELMIDGIQLTNVRIILCSALTGRYIPVRCLCRFKDLFDLFSVLVEFLLVGILSLGSVPLLCSLRCAFYLDLHGRFQAGSLNLHGNLRRACLARHDSGVIASFAKNLCHRWLAALPDDIAVSDVIVIKCSIRIQFHGSSHPCGPGTIDVNAS